MSTDTGGEKVRKVHIEVREEVRALLNLYVSTVQRPQYEVASELLERAVIAKLGELGVSPDAIGRIAESW